MRKPDFFIAGAPRSGTTSLYHALRSHPDVFMSEIKEPHFFGSDLRFRLPRISREDYLSLFSEAGSAKRIGEASTWYLVSRKAAEEIFDFNRDSRIIISLRNPVEMAYSLHSQRLLAGAEDESDFSEALKLEPARARGERVPAGCPLIDSLLYRRAAMYGLQVARFLSVFGEQKVHVQTFEEFSEDPREAYLKALSFLDLPLDFEPESFRRTNENRRVRSRRIRYWARTVLRSAVVRRFARALVARKQRKWFVLTLRKLNSAAVQRPVLPEDLRDELRDWFRPDIERLSDLLKRDLVQLWGL